MWRGKSNLLYHRGRLSTEPVRIAAFDLDNTVVDGESGVLFVRFLFERRLAPLSLPLEVAFWFALNHVGWKLEVPKIHARLISRVSSVPRDVLQAAIQEFTQTRLLPRVRRDAAQWMSRVRDEGCHIVLLSASLESMVQAVAEAMRADGYVGTRLHMARPGRLLVDGELIFGESKVRALEQYANVRFPSWRLEYAFGNDYGDRFLLQSAANPVAVCPSPQLRSLAEREGWTRADWR
jgi:HAD superfamily phosphoserine phosphatase-like hydrolase